MEFKLFSKEVKRVTHVKVRIRPVQNSDIVMVPENIVWDLNNIRDVTINPNFTA